MSADATQTDNGSGTESHGAVSPVANHPSLPLRMRTNTAEIDSTITHPGSVKINVKGAFIVDVEDASPNGHGNPGNGAGGAGHHDKDIRLPNHTAVVSHIAVDVGHSVSIHRKTMLLIVCADRRFFGQAGLLLSRATLARARWKAELHDL